jgi:hypothetical protein
MTTNIQININSDHSDPAQAARDIRGVLAALAATVSPDNIASIAVDEDNAEVKVEVTKPETKTPVKRGRGRPKKGENKGEPQADGDPEHDSSADTPSDVADKTVEDLSPADARNKAIKIMQKLYSADAAKIDLLVSLQGKYGVTKFGDVPDDKAHAFLADAVLAENGNLALGGAA